MLSSCAGDCLEQARLPGRRAGQRVNSLAMTATSSTAARSPGPGLLSVEEARARVLADIPVLDLETIPIEQGRGRVTGQDIAARLSHPPVPVSAMDGYALSSADAGGLPVRVRKIGESRAGGHFEGRISAGACVRIFTGAPVPEGADLIALQEDATEADGVVTITELPAKGQFIRRAGLDFSVGQVVAPRGRMLTARDLGLLASSGHGEVTVRRRPRVAILSTGDELVPPGSLPGPDQIVCSNGLALSAAVASWGAEAIDLGIAADEVGAIAEAADRAMGADILITSGGASVGDHDLVQAGIRERGFVSNFWQIAMRPGKPLMFGRIGPLPVLGVPGNPVSAMVCAMLFLRPVLRKLLGQSPVEPVFETARLGAPMKANDKREEYARGRLEHVPGGGLVVRPFTAQDSAMQRAMAEAHCLIRRPPHAPAATEGAEVEIIRLDAVEGGF
jgi:molybdopterin molybdotransferase